MIKKIFTMIFIVLILFVSVACAGEEIDTVSETTNEANEFESTVSMDDYEYSESYADEKAFDEQALSLTKHIVENVMKTAWFEDGYEYTYFDAVHFLSTLAIYINDSLHPYSDSVTLVLENNHYLERIELDEIERILFEVFGDGDLFPIDESSREFMILDEYMYMQHERGVYTSGYTAKDMTVHIDSDLVYVNLTLEQTKLFPYEKNVCGDYTFVYEIIEDNDDGFLRFVKLEKNSN